MEEFACNTPETHDGSNGYDPEYCIFSPCPCYPKHPIPPFNREHELSFTTPKSLPILQSTFGLPVSSTNMVTISSNCLATVETAFASVFSRICQSIFANS
jgi:hypothetical protein